MRSICRSPRLPALPRPSSPSPCPPICSAGWSAPPACPHLLAAAEPPLGLKARAGLGIVGAAAASALPSCCCACWTAAGAKGQARARSRATASPGFAAAISIRTRRFAGRFPPPAISASLRRRRLPDASEEPAPFWLPGREAEAAEPALEPRLDDRRSGFRGSDLKPDAPARRPIVATPDSSDPAAPVPEPARPPAPSWLAEAEAEAAESGHEPQAVLQPEPEPEPAPEPQPVRAPAAETSIAELMRRLEQGLARRRTHRVFSPAQSAGARAAGLPRSE